MSHLVQTVCWFFQKWPHDCQSRWKPVLASNGWPKSVFPEFLESLWICSATCTHPCLSFYLVRFIVHELLKIHPESCKAEVQTLTCLPRSTGLRAISGRSNTAHCAVLTPTCYIPTASPDRGHQVPSHRLPTKEQSVGWKKGSVGTAQL